MKQQKKKKKREKIRIRLDANIGPWQARWPIGRRLRFIYLPRSRRSIPSWSPAWLVQQLWPLVVDAAASHTLPQRSAQIDK